MKLALKLTIALVVGIVAILSIDAYLRVKREMSIYEKDTRRDQASLGRVIASAVAEEWTTEGPQKALDLVLKADRRTPTVGIGWRWLLLPPGEPEEDLLPPNVARRILKGKIVMQKYTNEDDETFLRTFVPVKPAGTVVGAVEITESLEQERKHAWVTIKHGIATTSLVVAFCALLILFLGFMLVGRPVHRLVAQARRVGERDFESRIELNQRDEMGDLALAMNLMSERLAHTRKDLASTRESLAAEIEARIDTMAQLRHADRLTTVGKLSSIIAHEMGTPLNVVSGLARMIECKEVEGEEITENARSITEQTSRMAAMIRQVLDFARRKETEKRRIDLVPVVQQALALLRPVARRTKVELSMEGGSSPVFSIADQTQIQQMVANLVMNGIQAMERGGNATVRFKHTRSAPPGRPSEPDKDWVVVEVEDEGAGIPSERLDQIFEPFYTTKAAGQGTGLGLSVCQSIVQEHGGWISVSSEEGRGSIFRVFLPAAEEEEDADDSPGVDSR